MCFDVIFLKWHLEGIKVHVLEDLKIKSACVVFEIMLKKLIN
jgi:hypothetical protein